MGSIAQLAQKWLLQDRNPRTRKDIEDLIATKNETELRSRLHPRIAFGTAGLRASMKAGFAHMNDLTVVQTSCGLADYLIAQNGSRPQVDVSVVIGHDARYHSEEFARLAAAAFFEAGLSVLWFDGLVHTPMVPFVVRKYGAAAGVMITASHNPKDDNGYKVYWSNGCQIIPPHDAGIAKSIETAQELPTWNPSLVDSHPNVRNVAFEAKEAYFEQIRALVSHARQPKEQLRFAYTPMHGVGLPFMEQVAAMYGSRIAMQVVQIQATPDPDFPTVPFPNPEEKGALTPAIKDAESNGCSLILANDPDADRFAAVERLVDGRWHQFTGNQMGVLLASYVLETYPGDPAKLALLASTVSSRMLASMAKTQGFRFQETLTGFKWLGNVAQDLERQGFKALYAYEEAIGYMFSDIVWDKDGIAAAAVFLSACLLWSQQGMTSWTKLQKLYQQYGYFEDANTYLISPSPAVTNGVFDDIRTSQAGSRPENLGERKILRWRDLTLGFDSSATDNKPDLPVDAAAQMITCELENVVFTARGSGTEPKIKLYIEAQAADSKTARKIADGVLQDLLREWFKPEYGLRLAGT